MCSQIFEAILWIHLQLVLHLTKGHLPIVAMICGKLDGHIYIDNYVGPLYKVVSV